jgi:hypothetical protein
MPMFSNNIQRVSDVCVKNSDSLDSFQDPAM